eukprot:TRINITY_DN2457_c0_g1_i1.p1 TRINITY_DN2457_c0_g1~~TRINITY_DN2457_c0_g1_i1.p1  ORF type:complete len:198 (-),score=63.42 TRINITY_DN2457_c0_g1_i1:68-616(-)
MKQNDDKRRKGGAGDRGTGGGERRQTGDKEKKAFPYKERELKSFYGAQQPTTQPLSSSTSSTSSLNDSTGTASAQPEKAPISVPPPLGSPNVSLEAYNSNFNANDISRHLTEYWNFHIKRLTRDDIPAEDRPEVYKTKEKVWGSAKGPLLTAGCDFWAELLVSHGQLVKSQQVQSPTTAPIK